MHADLSDALILAGVLAVLLGVGSKAGVDVAVAVGGLLVCAFGVALHLARRRR